MMRRNSSAKAGIFTLRGALALGLCGAAAFCGTVSLPARPKSVNTAPDGNWSIIHSADMGIQAQGGVDCITASDCWIVGYYTNQNNSSNPLARHWNGTAWTTVPTANLDFAEGDRLLDVDCVSTTDCWAVGQRSSNSTLVEHWDGSEWSIVASPNPSADVRLVRVACNSATDCWGVGWSSNGTLIEHWDGNSWSVVSSPNPGTSSNRLLGLACTSSSNCWA